MHSKLVLLWGNDERESSNTTHARCNKKQTWKTILSICFQTKNLLSKTLIGVHNKKASTETVDAFLLKMVGTERFELSTF